MKSINELKKISEEIGEICKKMDANLNCLERDTYKIKELNEKLRGENEKFI